MSFRNIILKAWFSQRERAIDRFRRRPVETQARMFRQLLRRGRFTEFGDRYDLRHIRSVERFQSQVETFDYETFKPYIERMMEGVRSVTAPGRVSLFARSSGTTSDRSKYIPVTMESLWWNHTLGMRDVATVFSANNPKTRVFEGKTLTLGGSCSREGRNLVGDRIGFDLGGSDRKCAAVVNGEVVYSEEVVWDPYFQKDPQYHIEGIQDSLERAAAHLPRVDAIGGSSAGVIINSEVRTSSLFRGVSQEDIEKTLGKVFRTLQKEKWNNIPFEVVNDGEVTALAGAMGMNDNAVLGVAMGTSEAAGYVDPEGHIKPWLNELAFAPVDYSEEGGVDEWSKDMGVGALYFSQQAVARLAPRAGFQFEGMPFPEQLKKVQAAMAEGDERARKIYETIGVHFGYAIAHYARFYDIRNLLFLGRVASGDGGQIIIDKAEEVLRTEFPELKIQLRVPDEKTKRHGQAVAAASLPALS